MKHLTTLLLLLIFCCGTLHSYTLRSPFLKDPESILPYLVESTDFWIPAFDQERGAFISNVGRDGTPEGNDMAFLAQSRNAYAFSKAFMITGDKAYLDYADRALRFMYQYGWDQDNEGWWGMAESNGNINTAIWYNATRWSFWQHYMLLGISAYVEATADPFHAEWLARGNAVNDTKLWDDRPGLEGYYNRTSLSWVPQNGKGFTPTVDALTTNALTNYLMTRSPMRHQRLLAVADNITDKMMDPANGHVVSFPSNFDNNWRVRSSSTETSIGHHIKTSWCLARTYLIEPDSKYRVGALTLLGQIWDHRDNSGMAPWDFDNGIMRGDINVFTGKVSGDPDWWTVEQGFAAGIMNWYISRRPEFLAIADQSLDYFMTHLYDYTYGEVFSKATTSGQMINQTKGDMFKAAYHSVELFYFTYLYANLYLHNRPVKLHYTFAAEDTDRDISLWPLAIEDDRLQIIEVSYDNEPFHDYEPLTRTVRVPAGSDGVFAVTFASRHAFNPPPHSPAEWHNEWLGNVFLSAEHQSWHYHQHLGWIAFVQRDPTGGFWFFSHSKGQYFYSTEAASHYIFLPSTGWQQIPL